MPILRSRSGPCCCPQPEEAEHRHFQRDLTYRDLEGRVEALVKVLSPPEPEELAAEADDEEANEVKWQDKCESSAGKRPCFVGVDGEVGGRA